MGKLSLTSDGKLLFLTRFVRLFAYGALSVILVLYLTGIGLDEYRTGLLLTCTLLGDLAVSLWLTTRADRFGRRRTLIAGSLLMAGAGLLFAATGNFALLILAGTIGVISPGGNEVGPFLAIEQASLSDIAPKRQRTKVFAWYTLAGSFANATGALFGGFLSKQQGAASPVDGYRMVVIFYAVAGILLATLFLRLSPAAEAAEADPTAAPYRNLLRLGPSHRIVLRLSALFALDSFAGGFVMQSFCAYWFYLRFNVNAETLGALFFGANLVAGVSALVASQLAAKIGLVKTMVFTHLPSNVLLILVPLMPTLPLAVSTLLLRFSISQMDVPARQAYTMTVVRPEERSATAGVTGVARTLGASIAPILAGLMFAKPALISMPFFIGGTLKIVYDLSLYRAFAAHEAPEN